MKGRLYRSLGPVAISFLLGAMVFGSQPASVGAKMPRNNVLARALAIELGKQKAPKWLMPLSSGVMYTLLQASGSLEARANDVSRPAPLSAAKTQGCQNIFAAGSIGGRNIRVNQDCSLRRQAEETIAINPNNANNLVAGQNDSRIGFNHCGYDWSFDGGRTWGDQVPPFWQFQLLDGHTSDACSDPTAAFDAEGNVYVGGVFFDLASPANAVLVAKSNAPIGGAFYHSPANMSFQEYRDVPLVVVANDPGPAIFNDKELMTADAHSGSPKANNVYMTWTRFNSATGAGSGRTARSTSASPRTVEPPGRQ